MKSVVFSGTILKADVVYLKPKRAYFQNIITPLTSCFIACNKKTSVNTQFHFPGNLGSRYTQSFFLYTVDEVFFAVGIFFKLRSVIFAAS